MAKQSNNRLKAFADLVSVDAWHDTFKGRRRDANLYADVVFGTARVGQEQDAEVTFRLSIARAEVVIVVPDNEPIRVDPRSVKRDDPFPNVKRTHTVETKTAETVAGQAKIALGAKPSASLNASTQASSDVSNTEKLVITSTAAPVRVTLSTTADGFYRWTCSPLSDSKLEGRGWDAATEPRLRLIDGRVSSSQTIAPAVRIEVGCLREDLVIEDLELKELAHLAGAATPNTFTAAPTYPG